MTKEMKALLKRIEKSDYFKKLALRPFKHKQRMTYDIYHPIIGDLPKEE